MNSFAPHAPHSPHRSPGGAKVSLPTVPSPRRGTGERNAHCGTEDLRKPLGSENGEELGPRSAAILPRPDQSRATTARTPSDERAATFRPTILIDSREQTPLPITGPWERATLTTGDYSYRGGETVFSVERKSLADLVGSLTTDRARFTREMERLRGYPFARLLVIGFRRDLEQGAYRSSASPLAMVNSLAAFEARYCPVVWAASANEAGALVERWAYWHAREILRAAADIAKGAEAPAPVEPFRRSVPCPAIESAGAESCT